MKNITFSDDQQNAIDVIERTMELPGFNLLFLTGKAGTGKTTILKELEDRHFQHMRVCAMTAIAAQLLPNATTWHKVFGVKPNPMAAVSIDAIMKNINNHKLLVIDEISMLSAGWFDDMCDALSHKRITVLLVGDLFQLPPVPDKVRDIRYSKKILYSRWWSAVKWTMLTTNHRQADDKRFGAMLDELRHGRVPAELAAELATRQLDNLESADAAMSTMLLSKREPAQIINMHRLANLVKSNKIPYLKYHARLISAKFEDGWQAKCEQQRVGYEVILAVGARVVALTNDFEGRWVNGAQGTVTAIGISGVEVKFDDDRFGTQAIPASIEHEVYAGDGTVELAYTQIPLRLGWASTIHSLQGSTLGKALISLENHFEAGMTYVALSRCRSLVGLKVHGTLGRVKHAEDVAAAYEKAVCLRAEDVGKDFVPAAPRAMSFEEACGDAFEIR